MKKIQKFTKQGQYTIDLSLTGADKAQIKVAVAATLSDMLDILLPGVNPVIQAKWSRDAMPYEKTDILEIKIKKHGVESNTSMSAMDYFIDTEESTLEDDLQHIANGYAKIFKASGN